MMAGGMGAMGHRMMAKAESFDKGVIVSEDDIEGGNRVELVSATVGGAG